MTHVADRALAPPDAHAANWAFDVTPHELVTAIVTEEGVLHPPFERSIARALAPASAQEARR